jgi:acetyl-CoA C-acetyltransferase
MGGTFGEGTTGGNIARQIALRAGLPVTTAGHDHQPLLLLGPADHRLAAQRIIAGEAPGVCGRRRRVHLVRAERGQHPHAARPLAGRAQARDLLEHAADRRAGGQRYGIGKQAQDEYGVRSQQRAAAAQAAGKFNNEIVPMTTTMGVVDKATGRITTQGGDDRPTRASAPTPRWRPCSQDPRRPARRRGHRRQRQPVLRRRLGLRADGRQARRARGLQPLGIFRGFAVAGCEPDEMGIGPVFAVPKLLASAGLKVDDIGLWELNEAFAVQVLYCRDKLGIPDERSTSTAAPSPSATPTA